MLSATTKKWALILAGTLVWSVTMVKSGLVYQYGMGFWGPNGHDGIWHISLIESLSQGRFDMPIFAGSGIQNYHIGFDLLLSVIHRLTFIPVITLYFQIIPPLLALLIGFFTYRLVKLWQNSDSAAWWTIFFVYFGGSWGWILGKGESTFWSQQAVSTLINPPFALSVLLLVVSLICLHQKRFWAAVLVMALAGQVKVYAGLLGLVGLFAVAVYELIRHRQTTYFKIAAGVLLISAVLFFPLNRSSARLIVFQPFWFLETMMSYSDRVGWTKFYSAMTNYRRAGAWPKAALAYLVAGAIFVLGNLGTRILAALTKPKLDTFSIFFTAVITAGLVIPLFFLQKGTPWNTIQFFYYAQFFVSILAGNALFKIKNLKLKIVVVLLTLPTTWITLRDVYLPSRPPAKVSPQELQALRFLRSQPPGIVMTPAVNPDPYAPPPRPLYLYESTAYVSALSGQPVFLEDEVNLDITGYSWPARRQLVEQFFRQTDISAAREFVQDHHITYIYLPQISHVRPILSSTQLGFVSVYENSQSAIWKKQ